ncbi:16680_t:CDS:2 [Gigaspora margarita]|uniref:16680_t:CDS:1 n=1 Tax=Gigaspora margarita TaxID=4874 RepID=A0ABN7V1U8_GIGMA|nr:16680_t:CDS:2 [Gigaspora margarita]
MDATGPNNNITNSLPPQTIQPIPTNDFEIPTQYMALLESEIFNFNKCFHHYCRRLWSKVKHAHLEAQKKMQKVYNISEAFGNSFDEVVVDFFDLVKPTDEENAIAVVDKYYSHNLNKDNNLKNLRKGWWSILEPSQTITMSPIQPQTQHQTIAQNIGNVSGN